MLTFWIFAENGLQAEFEEFAACILIEFSVNSRSLQPEFKLLKIL